MLYQILTFNLPTSRQVITETYSSGTDWYRIYSDGWCEQGGFVETGSAPTTVTLLKEMADTNYYANTMTDTTRSNPQNYDKIIQGKTTTSIIVNQWNNWFDSFVWQACGYIPNYISSIDIIKY